MKKRKKPYVLSLRAAGSFLRLEIDHAAAEHLLAWIGTNLGHVPGDAPMPATPPAPQLPQGHAVIQVVHPTQMDPETLHRYHHEHAPGALRELYRTLCDQLLDDAQAALNEEKARRADAS